MEALARGLIVDLITPLSADNGLDGPGLGRLIDRVLGHCEGVLLAGPHAGEGLLLRAEQRQELLDRVLRLVKGRVPVLAWITQETEAETLRTLALLARTAACRGLSDQVRWVDAPLLYHSNRGLPALYREMISLAPQPFVLLNDAGLIGDRTRPLKRSNLRTAVLRELAALDGLSGMVFLGTLGRSHNYQRAVRGHSGFRIYDGDEAVFLEHPSMNGVLSIGANLAPGAWQRITRLSLRLRPAESLPSDSLGQIWQTGQFLQALQAGYAARPVPVVKTVLAQKGIITGPFCLTPPGTESSEVTERAGAILKLLDEAGESPGGSPASSPQRPFGIR